MKKGFTLVELSIVLVIIGLLIGGILVGQSMIDSGKVNKTIQQFQQYNAAAMLFKDRYKCLPGDCNKDLGILSRWVYSYGSNPYSSVATSSRSNGNGLIGDFSSPGGYNGGNYAINGPEAYNFWATLEQFQYIPTTILHSPHTYAEGHGPGVASPTPPVVTKTTQLSGPNPTNVGGWWVFGLDGQSNQNFPVSPANCKNVFAITGLSNGSNGVIENKFSVAIDSKLDDGLPLTGRVFASGYTYGHNGSTYVAKSPTDVTWSSNCVNTTTTPNTYKTSYTGFTKTCDLIICSDF